MSEKLFIISGNYSQYDWWIKERGLSSKEWIYVYDSNTIRGIRNPGGRLVGTWYERPDAFDILVALRVASDKVNENLEKALVAWTEYSIKKAVV